MDINSCKSLQPYGNALIDYYNGEKKSALKIIHEDNRRSIIPMKQFFDPYFFGDLDRIPLKLCRGKVLDIGAGAGRHSLLLQQKKIDITALEKSPEATWVMRKRGIEKIFNKDIFLFADGPFDSLLLLNHGIGLAGSIAGVEKLLCHLGDLLSDDGQIFTDSIDIKVSRKNRNLLNHEDSKDQNYKKYVGENRVKFEYKGLIGEPYKNLFIDFKTLSIVAKRTGFKVEKIYERPDRMYLSRITKSRD